MSLADQGAKSVFWTVLASIAGRAVGLVGTLAMTRFLAPDAIGEVADAAILCMTANWLTIWGYGQYAVVAGRGEHATEVTWHATVFYVGLGLVSLAFLLLFGSRLTPMFGAPFAAQFIPGMALSIFIRRVGAMPERVLTRQMKFRASGLTLVAGEVTYGCVAVGLAAAGTGGMAIVYANLAQSVVVVTILIKAAGIRSWATPVPLRRERMIAMLRFGAPLGVQAMAHAASRFWDKLVVSHLFGTTAVGTYNMAYNIADIPAIHVGEQIALVLMPSMATLPVERRAPALERSAALLSLVIFPLAIGVGLVSYDLIALVLPPNEWQEVAPLLAVLTSLSVFRPLTWVMSAFLEAQRKTDRLMFLELGKAVLILGGIVALRPLGLRVATAAVGLGFGAMAIGGAVVVIREGVSPYRLLAGFVQPLLACGVMAVAVIVVRFLMLCAGLDHPATLLPVEVTVGAVVYVITALRVAPRSSRDLLSLVQRALRR